MLVAAQGLVDDVFAVAGAAVEEEGYFFEASTRRSRGAVVRPGLIGEQGGTLAGPAAVAVASGGEAASARVCVGPLPGNFEEVAVDAVEGLVADVPGALGIRVVEAGLEPRVGRPLGRGIFVEVLSPCEVEFGPRGGIRDERHANARNLAVLGKESAGGVAKRLNERRLRQRAGGFRGHGPGDGHLGNLVAVGEFAVGQAFVSHDEERAGKAVVVARGIALGVKRHGVAAVAERFGALAVAGQPERAEIGEIRRVDG